MGGHKDRRSRNHSNQRRYGVVALIATPRKHKLAGKLHADPPAYCQHRRLRAVPKNV
jgi:hypothetical protein